MTVKKSTSETSGGRSMRTAIVFQVVAEVGISFTPIRCTKPVVTHERSDDTEGSAHRDKPYATSGGGADSVGPVENRTRSSLAGRRCSKDRCSRFLRFVPTRPLSALLRHPNLA